MTEETQQTVTRVTKNTVAQIAALASTMLSKLLITIIIGRLFGAERVGEFAFVMTFTLMFSFLSMAGIPWALIREVATHRAQAHRYAENGLTIVTLTGLTTVPVMVGVAALLGRSGATCAAVGLAGLAMVFDGLAQVVSAVLNGFERMELAAIVIIVQEVTFLIVGALVLFLQLPFLWLFGIYVPSRLAGWLISLPLYRALLHQGLRPGWDRPFAQKLLRISLPYAANMALGPIYLRIDVVMLTIFQGNVATGIYEAATSIFYRFNVFARTVNNALMPLMAREFELEATRIKVYINSAIKYQVVLGMPLSVACVMLSGRLITVLYGARFEPSSSVFALLSTMVTLRFIDHTLATALTACDLQGQRSLAVVTAAIFNIAVNLVILPTYSFVGAAATTIFTEICFFIVLYFFLAKRVSHPLDFGLFLKPSLAGSAMAMALWLLRGLPLLVLLLVGGGIYLVVLLGLRTFSRQELQMLLSIAGKALALLRSRRFREEYMMPGFHRDSTSRSQQVGRIGKN